MQAETSVHRQQHLEGSGTKVIEGVPHRPSPVGKEAAVAQLLLEGEGRQLASAEHLDVRAADWHPAGRVEGAEPAAHDPARPVRVVLVHHPAEYLPRPLEAGQALAVPLRERPPVLDDHEVLSVEAAGVSDLGQELFESVADAHPPVRGKLADDEKGVGMRYPLADDMDAAVSRVAVGRYVLAEEVVLDGGAFMGRPSIGVAGDSGDRSHIPLLPGRGSQGALASRLKLSKPL